MTHKQEAKATRAWKAARKAQRLLREYCCDAENYGVWTDDAIDAADLADKIIRYDYRYLPGNEYMKVMDLRRVVDSRE